jgi:hypothetical protein
MNIAAFRLRPARMYARATLCAGAVALISTVAAAETIYRCESESGLVYSDRPCAADAEVHISNGGGVTVYDAPPISKRASEPPSKATTTAKSAAVKAARKSAAADAKRQATCAKLEQSIRNVRTKLRTGYGVKEGERLKSRQHQLAERRRTEKCR